MDKMKVFKENIFAWYNFKENAVGIVYSQDEDYRNILNNKINIVSEESQIQLDYVIFIGEKNITDKMQKIQNRFNDDTKIIVINENALSIKNISTYPNSEEILKKKDILTIKNLKNKMADLSFMNSNIYYAFPKFDMADIIFKSTFDISTQQIEKYIPTFAENETITLNEIEFLKKLICVDKSVLEIFANSYFIEFSKKENYQDVNYVSFNNTRKEEYRLMTILKNDVVQKIAVDDKAITHLENMKKNIDILKSQNINILDYVENGRCYSKLIKNSKTLDMDFGDKYNDLDYVSNKLNKIRNILLNNAIDYNEEIEKSLKEYDIDSNKIKNLKFLENAFIDFVPKNCFEIDNEFYFFDQEWSTAYLPVEFIIYRAIINCYDLVKKININELYSKLNLTEYIEVFEKINNKIMNDILDDELYNKIITKDIKKIDNIINDKNIAEQQIDGFIAEDKKKTDVIKELQEEDMKKSQVIKELQEEEAKKAQVIKELEEEEQRKLKYIENLKIEEENKANYIAVLENIKNEQEKRIDELNNINVQKDETINSLNEIIKVKDNQIEIYENMKAVKLVKKLRGKN